jgi:hypothetical protein
VPRKLAFSALLVGGADLGGLAPGARLEQRTLLSAVLYAGVTAAALYAIPCYFIDHLGLEHGQGG